MSQIKVEFTQEQINNLKIFLHRSTLNGAEVPAYAEIVNILAATEKDLQKD